MFAAQVWASEFDSQKPGEKLDTVLHKTWWIIVITDIEKLVDL